MSDALRDKCNRLGISCRGANGKLLSDNQLKKQLGGGWFGASQIPEDDGRGIGSPDWSRRQDEPEARQTPLLTRVGRAIKGAVDTVMEPEPVGGPVSRSSRPGRPEAFSSVGKYVPPPPSPEEVAYLKKAEKLQKVIDDLSGKAMVLEQSFNKEEVARVEAARTRESSLARRKPRLAAAPKKKIVVLYDRDLEKIKVQEKAIAAAWGKVRKASAKLTEHQRAWELELKRKEAELERARMERAEKQRRQEERWRQEDALELAREAERQNQLYQEQLQAQLFQERAMMDQRRAAGVLPSVADLRAYEDARFAAPIRRTSGYVSGPPPAPPAPPVHRVSSGYVSGPATPPIPRGPIQHLGSLQAPCSDRVDYTGISLNHISILTYGAPHLRGQAGTARELPSKLRYQPPGQVSVALAKTQHIGGGSYGEVWEYVSADRTLAVALKFLKHGWNDPEPSIINALGRPGYVCDSVGALVINISADTRPGYEQPGILMHKVNGALKGLITPTITHGAVMGIVKAMTATAMCLRDNGLYYTDYKSDNMLYQCSPAGSARVIYGDLGSIRDIHRGPDGLYSYPPPEGIAHSTPPRNSAIMVWGIGVTMMEMYYSHPTASRAVTALLNNATHQARAAGRYVTTTHVNNFISQSGLGRVQLPGGMMAGDMVESMFNPNPGQRITLDQIMDQFR